MRVETTAGTYEAGQVVVSAGAWNAHLLGAPFDRLLTVTRQVLHWFELEDASAYRADAPAFIWMHGATDVDYLYGFPPLPGDRRLKIATEQYATSTTADTVNRGVDPAESAKMLSGPCPGTPGRRHAPCRRDGRLPLHRDARPGLHYRPPPRAGQGVRHLRLLRAWFQAFRGHRQRRRREGCRGEKR